MAHGCRIIIVEDEATIARRLARFASEALGDRLRETVMARDLDDARAALDAAPADILLLDLNLSGDDGFDLLTRALAEPCRTIVVSANTDRAIEAFERGVVDFVPKPFDLVRLKMALERALDRSQRPDTAPKFLAATLAGRTDLIAVGDIVAIHGADDYAEIETRSGAMYLSKKTLNQLESDLPEDFLRIHRSHIANLNCAARLMTRPGGRYELVLSTGGAAPVSRSKISALRARFG